MTSRAVSQEQIEFRSPHSHEVSDSYPIDGSSSDESDPPTGRLPEAEAYNPFDDDEISSEVVDPYRTHRWLARTIKELIELQATENPDTKKIASLVSETSAAAAVLGAEILPFDTLKEIDHVYQGDPAEILGKTSFLHPPEPEDIGLLFLALDATGDDGIRILSEHAIEEVHADVRGDLDRTYLQRTLREGMGEYEKTGDRHFAKYYQQNMRVRELQEGLTDSSSASTSYFAPSERLAYSDIGLHSIREESALESAFKSGNYDEDIAAYKKSKFDDPYIKLSAILSIHNRFSGVGSRMARKKIAPFVLEAASGALDFSLHRDKPNIRIAYNLVDAVDAARGVESKDTATTERIRRGLKYIVNHEDPTDTFDNIRKGLVDYEQPGDSRTLKEIVRAYDINDEAALNRKEGRAELKEELKIAINKLVEMKEVQNESEGSASQLDILATEAKELTRF